MKKLLSLLLLIATILSFSVPAYATSAMYPHPDVEITVTATNGGFVTSASGRNWRNLFGTAVRPDMEYGDLRYEIYFPKTLIVKKSTPFCFTFTEVLSDINVPKV